MLYSNDGVNWTRRGALTTSGAFKIGFGNGSFCVVGGGGFIITSSNMVECLLTPITHQAL
jgi:hypothetical protein